MVAKGLKFPAPPPVTGKEAGLESGFKVNLLYVGQLP